MLNNFTGCINWQDYLLENGKPRADTYDEASGCSSSSLGGIKNPKVIILRQGTKLVRSYDPNDPSSRFGSWWSTPREMCCLMGSLGHEDFDAGRSEGSGILQKANAVLFKEWGKSSKSHMQSQIVVELLKNFVAYYGQPNPAYGNNGSSLGAYVMFPNTERARSVNQIFWSFPANYYSNTVNGFIELTDHTSLTKTTEGIVALYKLHAQPQWPFESF